MNGGEQTPVVVVVCPECQKLRRSGVIGRVVEVAVDENTTLVFNPYKGDTRYEPTPVFVRLDDGRWAGSFADFEVGIWRPSGEDAHRVQHMLEDGRTPESGDMIVVGTISVECRHGIRDLPTADLETALTLARGSGRSPQVIASHPNSR